MIITISSFVRHLNIICMFSKKIWFNADLSKVINPNKNITLQIFLIAIVSIAIVPSDSYNVRSSFTFNLVWFEMNLPPQCSSLLPIIDGKGLWQSLGTIPALGLTRSMLIVFQINIGNECP